MTTTPDMTLQDVLNDARMGLYFCSGKDFNKLMKKSTEVTDDDWYILAKHGLTKKELHEIKKQNTEFVKLTNFTELHRKHQFVTGENTDSEFLFFTTVDNIKKWMLYNDEIGKMVWQRSVVIPDDTMVCIARDKFGTVTFSAKKIILGDRKQIE